MTGHTDGIMSMGTVMVNSASTKQKMVTQSSTKGEVVGVYDVLPQMICTYNFLKAQALTVKNSFLSQENFQWATIQLKEDAMHEYQIHLYQ
jgi:hypothetical protein